MQTHPPAKHTAVRSAQVNFIATTNNVWTGQRVHPAHPYACQPCSCGMEQPRRRLTHGGGGGGLPCGALIATLILRNSPIVNSARGTAVTLSIRSAGSAADECKSCLHFHPMPTPICPAPPPHPHHQLLSRSGEDHLANPLPLVVFPADSRTPSAHRLWRSMPHTAGSPYHGSQHTRVQSPCRSSHSLCTPHPISQRFLCSLQPPQATIPVGSARISNIGPWARPAPGTDAPLCGSAGTAVGRPLPRTPAGPGTAGPAYTLTVAIAEQGKPTGGNQKQ